MPSWPSAPPPATGPTPPEIAPLEGGQTVATVFGQTAGTEVALRGLVVKVNRGILGFDWVHLQDGTGSATGGTNDLIVTTATGSAPAVGTVVLARGTVATDKDFGAGYKYAVLVEQGTFAAE